MANILAADDSPSIQRMITLTLETNGHDVTTADDGALALEEAKSDEYDLVITDINMPNMGGFELIKHLRELDDYQLTPILCLTTESSEEYKTRGRDAGANGWLLKPFEPDDLIENIERLI